MPTSFTESDLQFEFPDGWGVRAYDDHRFYKRLSGLGLKGVDFLLIDPAGEGHLYLVEVKNYRTRVRAAKQYVAEHKPAAMLAATVAAKYRHTQRALRAVQLYYRRKWWFRWFEKRILRSRKLQKDSVFWSQARALASEPRRHTLLLWLEVEVPDAGYRLELQQQLLQLLGPEVDVQIGDEHWEFG